MARLRLAREIEAREKSAKTKVQSTDQRSTPNLLFFTDLSALSREASSFLLVWRLQVYRFYRFFPTISQTETQKLSSHSSRLAYLLRILVLLFVTTVPYPFYRIPPYLLVAALLSTVVSSFFTITSFLTLICTGEGEAGEEGAAITDLSASKEIR